MPTFIIWFTLPSIKTQGPSMLLQMAWLHSFSWPSSIPLYRCTTTSFTMKDKHNISHHLYVESLKKHTNEQLQNRNRLKKLMVTQGDRWGEGWTGGVGLAYAHWGLWNGWPMGTCCLAQRTLPNILGSSTWEKNMKENGCVYMFNCITLLYSRNYHNLVNQPHFHNSIK